MLDGFSITRIDQASNQVETVIPIGSRPYRVAAGHGGVWVSVGYRGNRVRSPATLVTGARRSK